jgi:two-component SAPR family response regulator
MKWDLGKSKSLRVMLVDDSDTDLFINEAMIKYANFSEDIISFSSSSKAMEYLKKYAGISNAPEIPDVIFLDINMPMMNGFEFIREYQSLPASLREKCHIVLLSSTFNVQDIQSGSDNKEVVGLIAKPLTLESLNDMIGK